MKPATKHYYGLTLIEGDDFESAAHMRSVHPFQTVSVGDELAQDLGLARGRRPVVTRVVHFVSSNEDLDEIVDDVRVYYEEAGPYLRSV